jgi:hypothetical protein
LNLLCDFLLNFGHQGRDIAAAHIRRDDDAPLAVFARDLIWPLGRFKLRNLLEQDGGRPPGLRRGRQWHRQVLQRLQIFAYLII